MSGICAVWQKANAGRITETVASMAAGLSLAKERVASREDDCGAGVAVSARFETQQIYRNAQVSIACDADLHNHAELLQLAGDPEEVGSGDRTAGLLARLYGRFGAGLFEKLRGAFSVVLWDRRERRLLAAIDGFGIKRLAYYEDARIVLVASRTEALVRTGHVDAEINPRAIANILNFSSNLAPETIFAKVHRLAPGTILTASAAGTGLQKYWDMRYGAEGGSEAQLSRQLEELVERAVAVRCQGEAPAGLGAFLSGGTDSSTVVGMMTRALDGPAKAFSIGFQEQPFNELGYAQLAAQRFGSEHHTFLVGPQDCFDALPDMIRSFDEPFGNSSAIPTYFCARLAAQHGVKTLLAGDGGDELFGGNERYATDKIFQIYHGVPGFLRKGLIEPALAVLPGQAGIVGKAKRYVTKANLPGFERLMAFQFLRTHAAADIFTPDFLAALGNYSVADIPARHYANAAASDHLDRVLYVDAKITLADNDLPKVTCMAEPNGVQVRFPFLDQDVAEFSGRIPSRLKVKGFKKRYLFKQAFRNLLPREIISKTKHGFGIPVALWMKSDPRLRELSRDTLLSARAFSRGYFRRDFIEDVFCKHESDDSCFYGDTLWVFLALELWHRQVVDEFTKVAP